MIGFQLGREFKLSLAEIYSLFPASRSVYTSKDICILDGVSIDEVLSVCPRMGGVIKAYEIIGSTELKSQEDVFSLLSDIALEHEGKIQYGVSVFSQSIVLRSFLKTLKKRFQEDGISSRFVNKDFKNLSSAQIIAERLVKRGTDFSIIESDNQICVGKSFWVQDIDAYSKRDYSKSRDMQVGMLPPKLSQVMINLSGGKNIFDPFVGLGTVLIESLYMGNKEVYGSDLSDAMVKASRENILSVQRKLGCQSDNGSGIEKLNAKFIGESSYLDLSDAIVTEGYLGEVMTKKNISMERIERQKGSLFKIYTPFFKALSEKKFAGSIVISFPFWEMNAKYIYFNEIYDIINIYCQVIDPLVDCLDFSSTKQGSLLYKRKNQLVGREIFVLKMK